MVKILRTHMTVLYPNLCYNEMNYKETALYIRVMPVFKHTKAEIQ